MTRQSADQISVEAIPEPDRIAFPASGNDAPIRAIRHSHYLELCPALQDNFGWPCRRESTVPFALTWWSLTFPVGTFVTGTAQLATHTHLPAFKVAAVIAYVGLLLTWILVTVRTARGSMRGNLLKLPPSSDPIKAVKDTLR